MSARDSSTNALPLWIYRLMIASIVLGIALRFLWTHDMEYKGDEQYMFERSQTIGVSEDWPLLGMSSGAGPRNPGFSIWIFVALAKLFQITSPIGLVHAVIALNCLALVALGWMAWKWVNSEEREGWMWAAIFAAVNPIGIQFQRKIWAQSVLPIFCVAFLACWMRRHRPWGAFFWGFMGALLGQIHMSGFFFALAIVIWSLLKNPKNPQPVQWKYWFAGSAVGSISLLPWIQYMLIQHDPTYHQDLSGLLQFPYWAQWIYQSLGIGLRGSLGRDAFNDFTHSPWIGNVPTFGIGALHIAAAMIGLVIFGIGFLSLWKNRSKLKPTMLGYGSESERAEGAACLGMGIELLMARVWVYRHYLIVTFPIMHLWLSNIALQQIRLGRKLLAALAVVQLLISIGFLYYIHVRGGAPGGDYGVAYQAQRH